jgi:hypothetical protein
MAMRSTGKLRKRTRGEGGRLPPWQTREVRMNQRKWHYPADHVEKLTARCAEKLKQLRSERAEKRAAKKRIEDAARLMKVWRANPRWDRASRSND